MKPRGGAVFLAAVYAIITVAKSQEPLLTIKPIAEVQPKPVGKPSFLTCFVGNADPDLVKNLEWLDIHNKTINSDNPLTRGRFITEVMPAEKALVLIINSLQKNDAGVYTCRATYAGSRVLTKSVRIETIVAVTWEDAPEEQNPLAGSDYRVRCKVRAEPAPHVEWRVNGNDVPQSGRYVVETEGLLIQKVTEADDGIYTCRAFVIETGELAERNIKVEVHTPPVISKDMPGSLEAIDGESASLTCRASGKPKPTYSWIRGQNQRDLGLASDRTSVNEVTGVLTINRVTQEDNGEFKCVANNGAGSVEKSVRVLVVVKPKILEVKNISIAAGREAKMDCRATGHPLPAITFRKLSSPNKMVAGIQPEDDRIVVDQNDENGESVGTLVISPLEVKDDGLYACIARNKGGQDIKNGHLQVEFAPTFANSPMKEAWSWARRPINLTCIAESIPNATISWKFNDRDIERDPNYRKYGQGPLSSLLVTPTDNRFYGFYKCVAKNIHGEAYHLIRLQEAHVPSEILQSKLDIITATTITFSFIGPGSTGGRPVKAYMVQYKRERDNWNEAKNKTWPVDSPYILEGLEPQTAYNFRFAAVNEVGVGGWGAPQHRTMPKRSNPEEPIVLNQPVPEGGFVASPYADRFELRWKKPADNGEYIDRYEIEYCTVHKVNDVWTDTEAGCRTLDLKNPEQTSADIMELSPDTYYKVELRAHNAIGFSTPGQIILRTARGMEHYVNNISTQYSLSSSVLVALVVAALLVILIIVDISCFFVNDTGLLWLMCGKKSKRKTRDDDPKLGSEGKELLNNGNREGKIRIESTPMIEDGFKRDTTVEYDMKKSLSRTSFVGKDSAV